MIQRKCICYSATITRRGIVFPSHYIPNGGMSGISVETVHGSKQKKPADGGGKGEEGER